MKKHLPIAMGSLLIATLTASSSLVAGKPVEAEPWLDGPFLLTSALDLQATAVESPGIVYGDTIYFVENDVVLTNKQRSYVTVVCYQDGVVVYQASNWGEELLGFTMEDLLGQGLEWPGGYADCSASLIIREKKGKSYVLNIVDSVDFAVD